MPSRPARPLSKTAASAAFKTPWLIIPFCQSESSPVLALRTRNSAVAVPPAVAVSLVTLISRVKAVLIPVATIVPAVIPVIVVPIISVPTVRDDELLFTSTLNCSSPVLSIS